MDNCGIYQEPLSNGKPIVTLQQKGSDGVNRASRLRGDSLQSEAGDKVHIDCRRIYCKPESTTNETSTQQQRNTRSTQTTFAFPEHCLFCGLPAKCKRKRTDYDVFQVRTTEFKDNLLQVCINRDDEWSTEVSSRLAMVHDLHAADTVYHHQCSNNFRTNKNIPSKLQGCTLEDTPKRMKPGRPDGNARWQCKLSFK